MTSTVSALVVTVAADEVELASDVLWGLGVRAIEERLGDTDGLVELWTAVGEEQESLEIAVTAIDRRWRHRVVAVSTVASDAWRDHVQPIWVDDRLVIVPAWQQWSQPADTIDTADSRPLALYIEPAGAFGLGDHPTTRASLRALLRLLGGHSNAKGTAAGDDGVDVLDVGCGTGVIAIAAALMQPRTVRAIDIATAAVEATTQNASLNGVHERVLVDASPLAAVDGAYDVVVANILAPALISLAADLRRVTRHDGHLVISGILADTRGHVLAALAPMKVERSDVVEGWACVTLRH